MLALSGVSPAVLRGWEFSGANLTQLPYLPEGSPVLEGLPADLNRDGQPESVMLVDGEAEIRSRGQTAWRSPAGWQVTQARLADLNRDGQLELALLVWRPFRPWPVDRFMLHGGRIEGFQDPSGRSCHLILIGWRRNAYQEVWAGSALADPLVDFLAADLDGNGRAELIALEGKYESKDRTVAEALSIWEWNGFGFTLLDRQAGNFRTAWFVKEPDGEVIILTGS
jgi:hypothetical protein